MTQRPITSRQQRLNIRNLYCGATREEFLKGIDMAIEADDAARADVLGEMLLEYEEAGEVPHVPGCSCGAPWCSELIAANRGE